MKKQTKQRLIYARYLLPPILILLALAMMLIPSYRFVTDGKADAPISAFSLLRNSFDLSRNILFGEQGAEPLNVIFARALFSCMIVSTVLCALAVFVSVWCAATALRYFADDDEERAEKSRTLFITFFPNRILVCVAEALALPLLAFPYMMGPLYKNILNTRVVVTLCAPEPFFSALLLLSAVFVLSALCKRFEMEFDVDLFKKSRIALIDCEELEKDHGVPVSAESSDESRELNERIRQLLNKEKKDTTEDD